MYLSGSPCLVLEGANSSIEGLLYKISANSTVAYSRADVELVGEENVTAPIEFREQAGFGYVPGVANAARNGGTFLDWMVGATDLSGLPRVHGKRPDIACFEVQAGSGMVIFAR